MYLLLIIIAAVLVGWPVAMLLAILGWADTGGMLLWPAAIVLGILWYRKCRPGRSAQRPRASDATWSGEIGATWALSLSDTMTSRPCVWTSTARMRRAPCPPSATRSCARRSTAYGWDSFALWRRDPGARGGMRAVPAPSIGSPRVGWLRADRLGWRLAGGGRRPSHRLWRMACRSCPRVSRGSRRWRRRAYRLSFSERRSARRRSRTSRMREGPRAIASPRRQQGRWATILSSSRRQEVRRRAFE